MNKNTEQAVVLKALPESDMEAFHTGYSLLEVDRINDALNYLEMITKDGSNKIGLMLSDRDDEFVKDFLVGVSLRYLLGGFDSNPDPGPGGGWNHDWVPCVACCLCCTGCYLTYNGEIGPCGCFTFVCGLYGLCCYDDCC